VPFTPYHFGPSGFLALVFRKWIDLPVFVLANVVVDIEVLVIGILDLGWPVHRYAHTLFLGAAAGIAWAIAAYPLRNIFAGLMQSIRLPYKTSLWKMIVSGILGVWLHVLIDSAYHFDLRLFWPNKKISLHRTIVRHIGHRHAEPLKDQIEIACIILLLAAVTLYVLIVNRPAAKQKNTRRQRK
jgi:membrane-bound metal-dependent hydrolase YbcI (DUF457 family)